MFNAIQRKLEKVMFRKGKFDTFRVAGDLRVNAYRVQPGARSLEARGLSLPGYGLDLEVRPYPLAVRTRDALHALAGEDVSSFLERMTASKVAGLRLH